MFLGTTVLLPPPNKHILLISFYLFISVTISYMLWQLCLQLAGPPDSHRTAELRYSLPKGVSIDNYCSCG